ncbi:rhamnan synthesis F family protein [Lichenibacterium ramalinae]|uniref:Glycosyltransferase n=1 Tax=Lichenibacterium ramalinae TaxID=2316527 RepID=A0A4Q2R6I7_9HYPH|nr:rhamnan synthesis F family protein [Lichenibacterium ramalinae]RYB02177.1 glycosyltransferase [Lichenibacterium ramalinae]
MSTSDLSSPLRDLISGTPSRAARLAYLAASPLFDARWYLEQYPDLAGSGVDAVEHFLDCGGFEGRYPHPLFHSDFYLEQNPDVRGTTSNPLIHYLERGAAEGRDPNPLFDTDWYVARYMRQAPYATNPLEHYLFHPDNDASLLFHSRWYRHNAMQSVRPDEHPLVHYFRQGRDAGALCNDGNMPDMGNVSYQILMSGLFDAEFYLETYADVAAAGFDPFGHYMQIGYKEGRIPNLLLDIEYYFTQVPESEREGMNPLAHFFERGAALDLNPNYFFDTAWYKAEYPACGLEGSNPLAHFLKDGGWSANPSPRFDAGWYLTQHEDVARAGLNPLKHYLWTGMNEGRAARRVKPARSAVAHVSDAKLVIVKARAQRGRRTALLVTHSARGTLKGHLQQMVDGYRRADVDVVLIVAADRRRTAIPQSIVDACQAVYVRENIGFDFGAWAHVLRSDDTLLDSDLLVLTNDSLLGPLDPEQLTAIFDRISESQADVVGLTENTFYAKHVQSFFLALKRRCLSSYGFNRYLAAIVDLETKNEVITTYELTFSSRMKAEGLRQEVLFAGAEADVARAGNNRMIFEWRALLDEGLPFVKASLVLGEHRSLGEADVRAELASRGFDVGLLEATHRYPGPLVWADLDGPSQPNRVPRVAFFGPPNVANGLGMASRGYVKALHRTGWPLNLHPIERPFHIHAKTAPSWQARSFSGPADLALVHFNGDSWDALLTPQQRREIDAARLKVGLFVWETSFVPDDWLPTIDELDAIWVPTAFCADILRSVTGIPVHVVPYVVENEPAPPAETSAAVETCRSFGLAPQKRHILYAFDGSSFLARKNPQVLIRAFRAAGLARAGWQLVLKTKHVFDLPTEGRALLDLVGTAGDVVVIDQPLSRTDLAALFALCPIYASSHASEGFGLTIAEAMEMGKVVVATDYGGSRDFLDPSCGFPVKAREVALEQSHGPYLRGAVWGEIDEEALAAALREAVESVVSGAAAEIGTAARSRIRADLSVAAVAAAMAASFERLSAGGPSR